VSPYAAARTARNVEKRRKGTGWSDQREGLSKRERPLERKSGRYTVSRLTHYQKGHRVRGEQRGAGRKCEGHMVNEDLKAYSYRALGAENLPIRKRRG